VRSTPSTTRIVTFADDLLVAVRSGTRRDHGDDSELVTP
jgi:hypothetical protein